MPLSLVGLGLAAMAIVLFIYFAREPNLFLAAVSFEVFAAASFPVGLFLFWNFDRLPTFGIGISAAWFICTSWCVLWTFAMAVFEKLAAGVEDEKRETRSDPGFVSRAER
ncbi:MAG: hypothetical protein HYT42_00380 [Candidatus Sungbacteria bacterium]|nr:hypothetical protein [Candidatus Sungbacteria bacterium]